MKLARSNIETGSRRAQLGRQGTCSILEAGNAAAKRHFDEQRHANVQEALTRRQQET
jgi:hypothetical protein